MKSEQTKKVTRKNAGREGAPPAVMFEAMTRSVVGLRERVCSLGGLEIGRASCRERVS